MPQLRKDTLRAYIRAYEKWVVANEQTIGDLEMSAKWASYLIAGRISNSPAITELVYTLSNLMVWYHDHVIYKSKRPRIRMSSSEQHQPSSTKTQLNSKLVKRKDFRCQRIKILLTTIEHSQVLFEIGAQHYLGAKAKWYLIAVLQLVKAALRLYIVNNSMEQIVTTPAIVSLNRKKLKSPNGCDCSNLNEGNNYMDISYYQQSNLHNNNDDHDLYCYYFDDDNIDYEKCCNSVRAKSYRLKRSGHIIRKIEGAPTSIQNRSFNLQEEFGRFYVNPIEQRRGQRKLLYGEYLYIAKPLLHLSAMGLFGEKGWSQYMVSLLLDFASINIYQRNRHLMTKKQQTILSYRCMNLCTYLLRSPFYEGYCRTRIECILDFLQQNIPFARHICAPIQEYIPHWQNIYFHVWST